MILYCIACATKLILNNKKHKTKKSMLHEQCGFFGMEKRIRFLALINVFKKRVERNIEVFYKQNDIA